MAKVRSGVSLATPPDTYAFADWPFDIPKLPGAYAIWRGPALVYVGMSGKRWTPQRPGESHLRRRLSDHANATRADVLPTVVFERFVGRHLSDDDWAEIENGHRHMSDHAKAFIRRELSFSYVTTEDPKQAADWEVQLRKGALGQKPLINPLAESS